MSHVAYTLVSECPWLWCVPHRCLSAHTRAMTLYQVVASLSGVREAFGSNLAGNTDYRHLFFHGFSLSSNRITYITFSRPWSFHSTSFPINKSRTTVVEVHCVRKVTVHLQKLLEVTSTSVYTGLNPFNFIRKHFLQIFVRKVAVHLQKCWKWCPRANTAPSRYRNPHS
jgi:hypothetical protein